MTNEDFKHDRSPSLALIDRLIDRIETRLDESDAKVSIGDYIRLLQLRRELAAGEEPKEVRVRWVINDEDDPDDGSTTGPAPRT
jgi:hypothetical protein